MARLDTNFDLATIIALIALAFALYTIWDTKRSTRTIMNKQDVAIAKQDVTIGKADTTLREISGLGVQMQTGMVQIADLQNTQTQLLAKISEMYEALIEKKDVSSIRKEAEELQKQAEKKRETVSKTLTVVYNIADRIGLRDQVTVRKEDKDGKLMEETQGK